MHLTLTVNQVMARRRTNKEGSRTSTPLPSSSRCRPSFPTKRPDIADWNQSPTETSRENGPGRKYRAVTRFYDVRLSSVIYVHTYGNGDFSKADTSTLAVAIVAGRFKFPPTISNISYFLYSHFVPL